MESHVVAWVPPELSTNAGQRFDGANEFPSASEEPVELILITRPYFEESGPR